MDPACNYRNEGYANAPRTMNQEGQIVRWNDLHFTDLSNTELYLGKSVSFKLLKGTHLACGVNSNVSKWENRMAFIEKMVADIFAHCPKKQELCIVSIGPNQLLLEYITGKTLIENEYKNIKFLMVDPAYLPAKENYKSLPHLNDFKTRIRSIYKQKNGELFAADRIKFLSRAQNIQNYFPENANVVVIESLPPYSEIIKDMKLHKVESKSEKDLCKGGRIIAVEQANSVSFVPFSIIEMWEKSGIDFSHSLPLSLLSMPGDSSLANEFPNPLFCVDWGCKIFCNGTYSVSFTGAKRYFSSCMQHDQLLPLENVMTLTQWTLDLLKEIKNTINVRVKEIKSENPQAQLSQNDVAQLLLKISTVARQLLPLIECFYTADYCVDRTEAMEYLAANAGHQYRKVFQLLAHPEMDYEIVVKDI